MKSVSFRFEFFRLRFVHKFVKIPPPLNRYNNYCVFGVNDGETTSAELGTSDNPKPISRSGLQLLI